MLTIAALIWWMAARGQCSMHMGGAPRDQGCAVQGPEHEQHRARGCWPRWACGRDQRRVVFPGACRACAPLRRDEPVLVKPERDNVSQVVLRGQVDARLAGLPPRRESGMLAYVRNPDRSTAHESQARTTGPYDFPRSGQRQHSLAGRGIAARALGCPRRAAFRRAFPGAAESRRGCLASPAPQQRARSAGRPESTRVLGAGRGYAIPVREQIVKWDLVQQMSSDDVGASSPSRGHRKSLRRAWSFAGAISSLIF